MFAKYLVPYCIKPVFLNSSRGEAMKCGFFNGLLICAFITIVSGLAALRFYMKEQNEDTKKQILKWYGIAIGVVWVFVTIFSWYGHGNMWEGYQGVIEDLVKQGFTRMQAISFLQNMDLSVSSALSLGPIQGMSAMVFASSKNGGVAQPKQVTEEKTEEKST